MGLLHDLIKHRSDVILRYAEPDQLVFIDLDLIAVDIRVRLVLNDDMNAVYDGQHIDLQILLPDLVDL